jgi:hypothetical protein
MDLHTHGPSEHGVAPGVSLSGEQPIGGLLRGPSRPMPWLLVAVIAVAFVAGGFAVIEESWPLFWVCLAVVVLSVPVGRRLGILRDTVLARDPSAPPGPVGLVAEDLGAVLRPSADPAPAVSVPPAVSS